MISFICDWICKNHPKLHKNWNPIYCWTLTYTLVLSRNTKYMAIDGQVCFHRWLFIDPVKPPWCTTGSGKPVNGINKEVSGARLLPMTVLTYPVDWVSFALYWRHSTAVCVLMKGITCLWLPTNPHNPPYPPFACQPLIHAFHDILVAMTKIAQNPALLDS